MGVDIYIGGNKWSVRHHPTDVKVKGKDVWGWSNSRAKEIRVRSGLGQDTQQTLFHELVHSICKEYSSAGSKTQELLGLVGNDEVAIDILAKELSGALRQLGLVK